MPPDLVWSTWLCCSHVNLCILPIGSGTQLDGRSTGAVKTRQACGVVGKRVRRAYSLSACAVLLSGRNPDQIDTG